MYKVYVNAKTNWSVPFFKGGLKEVLGDEDVPGDEEVHGPLSPP